MRSVFVLVLALSLFVVGAFGSSHSEAPNTADSPISDWSDLYVFRSYESGRDSFFTVLANLYPLQAPFGGPNYFTISDQYYYEIYFDTDANCIEDIGFRFMFGASLGGPTGTLSVENNDLDCSADGPTNQTVPIGISLSIGGKNIAVPLKFVAPVTSSDQSGLNWFEYYTVEAFQGTRDSTNVNSVVIAGTSTSTFTKPFDNAGTKSFPDYETYAGQYVYDIDFSGGACADGRMFVGQRADPFYISLGKVFDLIHFVPIPGFPGVIVDNALNNDLKRTNVHVIAMELPISCFADASTGTIDTWVGTRKLVHQADGSHVPGLQVSRLGSPLVNEIVIGLRDKGAFSVSEPQADTQFATYVTNPTFPEIVSILFVAAVNSQLGGTFTTIAPTNFPRNDLIATFLTGISGINSFGGPCEYLRLNTSIAAVSSGNQMNMGVIDGDNAGFPNGRRPGDDVLDIALRVVMGRLCHIDGLNFCTPDQAPVGTVDFTDGSPVDSSDFQDVFPYLNVPYAGGYAGTPQTGCASLDFNTGGESVSF